MSRPDNYRFESGALIWLASGLVVAALIGLVIAVIVTGGNAFAVGMLIITLAAAATGLTLDGIDRSRRSGSTDMPEEYWGFRGRPGA